MYKYCKMYY